MVAKGGRGCRSSFVLLFSEQLKLPPLPLSDLSGEPNPCGEAHGEVAVYL